MSRSRSYPRLGIVEFAEHLLTSGDLDPVYLALNSAPWPEAQRLRWLVAYCALYHCGAASFLSESEGADFWTALWAAATDASTPPAGIQRWPRGHERRHFRAVAADAAIRDWAGRFDDPADVFPWLFERRRGQTIRHVMDRAQQLRGCGPWMAFKMADLADACCGAELDQSEVAIFLYKTPRESLALLWSELNPSAAMSDETGCVLEALGWLRGQLSKFSIPHKPGQPLDLLCIETIACKHLSHRGGFYPLFNDIEDIREGLDRWASSAAAVCEFAAAMPSSPSDAGVLF